jgi:hypothetical protein
MSKKMSPSAKRRAVKRQTASKSLLPSWKKKLMRSMFPPPTRRSWQPSPYEAMLRDYAAYEREINAEIIASGSGLKGEQDTQSVLARYASLFSPRNIKMTRGWVERLPGRALIDRHERSAWAILEGLMARRMAGVSDLAANAAAQGHVALDGRGIPYHDLLPALSRTKDPLEREKLWQARTDFIDEALNPLLVDENRLLLKTLRRQGFENLRQLCDQKKRLGYDELAEILCRLAAETETVYMDAMHGFFRRRMRVPFPGASRAHEAYFLCLREFDRLFPADRLYAVCTETFRGLGLDLGGTPNLHVDAEDRPQKDPRAFCVSTNAPDDVTLVFKPRGGAEDYAAFLHEAGHAWHYAMTDVRLPYEHRAMPRSLALTETYAALMEMLQQNESWLVSVAGLAPAAAKAFAKRHRLTDLYLLRRHIGKLQYEMEFHRHPADNWRNRFYYRTLLTALTGVNHDDACYLEDMDEDLYSADYLRAWLAEAHLRRHLVRTYGQEWFRSAAAGEFLRSLWAKGDSWECEDLIRSLGFEPWDTAPLKERFTDL